MENEDPKGMPSTENPASDDRFYLYCDTQNGFVKSFGLGLMVGITLLEVLSFAPSPVFYFVAFGLQIFAFWCMVLYKPKK